MTRKSYLQRLFNLEAEQKHIENKILALKEEWKSQCKIKEGDKVQLTIGNFHLTKGDLPDTFVEVYVGNIDFGRDNQYTDLQFEFLYPKKDGTPSKKVHHITFGLIKEIKKIK